MDGLQMIQILFLGLIFCSHNNISASVLEVTVRPGENITLHCDCKASSGVFIVWFFRNCSREIQSTHAVTLEDQWKKEKTFPRLKFLKNDSSESYDLLVMKVTDSDVGFYFCGTKKVKVEKDKDEKITRREIYTYGIVTTRLTLNTYGPYDLNKTVEDCSACWKLLFSVCPAVFFLSVLLSLLGFYLLCHKTGKENLEDGNQSKQKRPIEEAQDENLFYAALEIHRPSKRKNKKLNQSSAYRTHTAVRYAYNEDSHSLWRCEPS